MERALGAPADRSPPAAVCDANGLNMEVLGWVAG